MTELLIIKPSSLGDIVQALQVATSLKAQRADLRISWIVREIFAPIVRACEAVDHVYVFDRDGGAKGFLKLMREVRATKFDYVFDMQGLLRTGLMTSRARAKHKVGRSPTRREWAGIFYNEKVPLPPGRPAQPRPGHPAAVLPGARGEAGAAGSAPVPRGRQPEPQVRRRDGEGRGRSCFSRTAGGAEKKWGGFKQLTELILREDKSRKVVWAGSNVLPGPRSVPGLPVPQPDREHEPRLAAGPRQAGRLGRQQRQRPDAPRGGARGQGLRDLRPHRPAGSSGPIPSGGPLNHVIQAPVGDLKLLSARDVYARFQRIRGR